MATSGARPAGTHRAAILLRGGVSVAGGRAEDSPGVDGVHLLTPETATTTHYFFGAVRHHVDEDPARTAYVRDELSRLRRFAFDEQDKPMIEAQQARILALRDSGNDRQPALLSVDTGPARLAKVLASLEAQEQSVHA